MNRLFYGKLFLLLLWTCDKKKERKQEKNIKEKCQWQQNESETFSIPQGAKENFSPSKS